MRRAYESLCNRPVDDFADGTPRWVPCAIDVFRSLRDQVEKGLVKRLEIVHIQWLV
jgi:hypothetical protein